MKKALWAGVLCVVSLGIAGTARTDQVAPKAGQEAGSAAIVEVQDDPVDLCDHGLPRNICPIG